MLLSQQADKALRPIDNNRKEIRDVTAKHTHVEGFCCCDRGILAPKHDFTIVFTSQSNAISITVAGTTPPHSTKSALSNDGLKTEGLRNVYTQYGAVGTSIQQKRRLDPRAITRLNLRAHHWAYDAIIAHMPRATDQHRPVPSFLGGSGE
jgi:hypothetical protein